VEFIPSRGIGGPTQRTYDSEHKKSSSAIRRKSNSSRAGAPGRSCPRRPDKSSAVPAEGHDRDVTTRPAGRRRSPL
jgi:hypothetical protein